MLCEDCGLMIWGDDGEKYLVPWMNESRIVNKLRRRSIQPAVDLSQVSDFDESFLILRLKLPSTQTNTPSTSDGVCPIANVVVEPSPI